MEKWKQVIFSGESIFEVINRKSKVLTKRFKSEKYTNRFVVPRLQGGGGSVEIYDIWGCFNFNEMGLHNIFTDQTNTPT